MSELPKELSETAKHAGLIHKLLRALDAAGLDARDLNRIAEDAERCRQLYGAMRGWMKFKPVEFEIDCDSSPSWGWGGGPNWPVEKHVRQGQVFLTRLGEELYLDGHKIGFHIFDTQPSEDKRIDEFKLEAELKGKYVLNANVMLFLRRHPQIIPEQWRWIGNPEHERGKSLAIQFWGTQIRHIHGDRCIPHMYCVNFADGFWEDSPGWIGKNQYRPGVAAVLQLGAA